MFIYISQALPCSQLFPIFTKKLNNWNSEKVYLFICGCLLVVYARLLVVCARLWLFAGGLWSYVVVCGHLLVMCGRLLMVCGRLWWFVVVCWWFVVVGYFRNYVTIIHADIHVYECIPSCLISCLCVSA